MSKNKSKTVTLPAYDLEQITALTAAGLNVIIAATEPSAPATALRAKKAKKAEWTDRKGRTFAEAKTAHYEARMVRAEGSARKGLRSSDRRTIAAELGYGYTDKQFTKAAKAYKAAGRHI